jgi:uncharacterized protein
VRVPGSSKGGHFWHSAFGLAAVVLNTQTAYAQSFDCTKASTAIEHTICADPSVGDLDRTLARTLDDALLRAPEQRQWLLRDERHWLAERDKECQQFERESSSAVKCLGHMYADRIDRLSRIRPAEGAASSSADVPVTRQTIDADYHFRMTLGTGVPACEAYLTRLNGTRFHRPPQCEVPEDDSVPGFSRLNRVPLRTEEITALWPHIFSFSKFLRQMDDVPGWPASDAKLRVGTDLFAWRYDPPISVGNDGRPDNIVVWQDGASSSSWPCGDVEFVGPLASPEIKEVQQVPFVLAADNSHVDEERTERLFGHPKGNVVGGLPLEGFRPIGSSIGFFMYRNRVYFETFYAGWTGDYQGNRVYRFDPTKSLSNTLAVFLRERGMTKQVCEYQMSRVCHGDRELCPRW